MAAGGRQAQGILSASDCARAEQTRRLLNGTESHHLDSWYPMKSCQHMISIWNLGSLLYSTFLATYHLGYIAPAKLLYSKGAISILCYIATCYISIL